MKHLVILIVAAGSLITYSQTTHAQTAAQPPTGEIKGTVTDRNGIPVAGATVYAVPQGLSFNDISPRAVKTDSDGRFDFRGGFQLETYKLYSRKEADAYPDPIDRFYADSKDKAPEVELAASHPSATITVKLVEKAGVLTGRIIDADTGAPASADLAFLDENGNGLHIRANGTFRALLPAGKTVTLLVETVSGPYLAQRPVAPFRLEPGQYVSMDIPVSRQ